MNDVKHGDDRRQHYNFIEPTHWLTSAKSLAPTTVN